MSLSTTQDRSMPEKDFHLPPVIHTLLAWTIWLAIGTFLYRIVIELTPILAESLPQNYASTLIRLFNYLTSRLALLLETSIWILMGLFIWNVKSQPKRWITRLTYDTSNLQHFYNGTENGTATFATLAGFSIVQGAALTAVASREGRDLLVLAIYSFSVLFSFAWAYTVIATPRPETNHFDITTLVHARYTLSWILFCGTIMFILGCMGLLPNQDLRTTYRGNPSLIMSEVKLCSDIPEDDKKLGWLKKLITSLPTSNTPNYNEFIITSAQKDTFISDHHTFRLRIIADLNETGCNEPIVMLVKDPSFNQELTTRLMTTQRDVKAAADEQWITEAKNPKQGERLVVIWKINTQNTADTIRTLNIILKQES